MKVGFIGLGHMGGPMSRNVLAAGHDLTVHDIRREAAAELEADGATWAKRAIDEGGMAGAGCAAADLNADKRMDIVCIGTATANLKWYENVGKK